MRNVVSLMHMSLDGFVAGPDGEMDWITLNDDVFSYVERFIDDADTGLYGPITFGMMESYWPSVLKNPKASGHQRNHSKWYENAGKVVFSRRLGTLDNQTAKLVKDNLAGEIKNLKNSPGKNLMIFGSPRLVHSFAQLGLIDEFVITVNPIVLGAGIPMFAGIDRRIGLELVNSTELQSGVVGLHYISQPKPAAIT
jgi:dihydrofolate reductase